MTTEPEEKESRLETIVAILIAVVTVIGAVVAWRASVAADGAGDADFAGLKASLNAEETRALNFVNAYEHYGAYINYSRYLRLGNAVADDLSNGVAQTEAEAFWLDRQRAESFDLANANQELFPNRFLGRDGSYGVQRELGEAWADASKEKDLDPNPHYAEADKLREKTNLLLSTLTLLGVGLVFFTLVEAVGERGRYPLIGLALLFSIGGTVAAIVIEFTR
ncbi:MAG TPA: hypothetical protein VI547_15050 [Anaerolineales bacterium]|nr:hypothetical protein [Anaerolineales bacterium]